VTDSIPPIPPPWFVCLSAPASLVDRHSRTYSGKETRGAATNFFKVKEMEEYKEE